MAGKAKRALEIERALHWAYRDELAKRAVSSAEGIWDRMSQYGSLGGINPDPGHGAAQRYPHFGLPHPDAEKIEQAVSALPDLILDWSASCDAIMGDLAGIIEKRDILMVRSLRTAALVTMHAGMGTRPDWRSDPPRPVRVPSKQDASRPMLVGVCHGANRYSPGSYNPLQYEPSPMSIAVDRAEYCAWHRGLVTLAESLELAEIQLLPPSAPAQPWLGEREPPRRVFAVGERPPHERPLPLKPQRPRALPPLKRKNKPEPEKQTA
jgi:hypothetical protein